MYAFTFYFGCEIIYFNSAVLLGENVIFIKNLPLNFEFHISRFVATQKLNFFTVPTNSIIKKRLIYNALLIKTKRQLKLSESGTFLEGAGEY